MNTETRWNRVARRLIYPAKAWTLRRLSHERTSVMGMDDFIPPGFVPLANWDSRNRRNNDGHSVEWKALSDAVKDGEIPGFKLSNGRWYVHQQSAEELLTRPAERTAEPKRASSMSPAHYEAAVVALCEINNGITLMHAVLERLTATVERIAKGPDVDGDGN